MCVACLKVSRAAAPSRRDLCPGFNKVMADLVANPLGHTLSFSSFLDDTGIITLCTRCGGYCSSNRRAPKLADPCLDKPLSACAKAALERLRRLQHPSHAKGDGVALSAWRPLTDLTSLAAERPAGERDA